MRRSDEEFKAELRARARKYRAARERRRVAVLKTVSAVMAACLLIVVISQVDFSWIGKNPDISQEDVTTEGNTSSNETLSAEQSTSSNMENTLSGEESLPTEDRDNTVSGEEETEQQITENATVGEYTGTEENVESPEDESVVGDITSDSTELKKTVASISIKVGGGVNWQGGEEGDTERYEGSEEAEQLGRFLEHLWESLPKPEGSFNISLGSSSAEVVGDVYDIVVRFSDNTKIRCKVVQSTMTEWVSSDIIMLDQTDWATLMELFDLVRGNYGQE